MFTKVEREFADWKKKTGYKSVNESFLDDDDETTPVTDSLTVADTLEDKPDEDSDELVGDKETVGTDGGDEPVNAPEEEPEEDDGVTKSQNDLFGELKDVIGNLNTTVQELKDQLAKKEEETAEESSDEPDDEFADLDLGGDESGEDEESAPADEGDESGESDSGESNSGEEESSEGEEESKDSDDSDDGESSGSDEEYTGDDESDDEKSEAYNFNMKRGKLLNSNSGSLIGPLEAGKYWKIDEGIITLAKLKLRQRIEKRKRDIRTKYLAQSEGEE